MAEESVESSALPYPCVLMHRTLLTGSSIIMHFMSYY